MPRSSRGGGRPAPRPAAAPPRPAAPQQQSRPYGTAAAPATGMQTRGAQPGAPATAQQGQAAQGKSPGLFGQMASTAAGVAVGSSIGHAIGGFFGGGSSAPAEEQSPTAYQQPSDAYAQPGQTMDSNLYGSNSGMGAYGTTNMSGNQPSGPCANDIKSFTDCMNQNAGDLNVCGWYMQQLQACQIAARQYTG